MTRRRRRLLAVNLRRSPCRPSLAEAAWIGLAIRCGVDLLACLLAVSLAAAGGNGLWVADVMRCACAKDGTADRIAKRRLLGTKRVVLKRLLITSQYICDLQSQSKN
jgi:hypothetical protein